MTVSQERTSDAGLSCGAAYSFVGHALLGKVGLGLTRISNPLVLLSTVAYSTLEFAKSQLEWMIHAVTEAFERDRDNPFQTR